MSTRPAVGGSRPASKPSSADLPEPDTPTIATDSPAFTSKLMSRRMVNSESPVTTCLPNPATRMIGAFENSGMRSAVACVLLMMMLYTSFAATIMVYGDSLSAGYGLPQDRGWVSLMQRRLHDEKFNYKVVNASISGETTLGGRNRLTAALDMHRPAIVILALGANDGLRGQSPDAMRVNLEAMVQACR